MVAAKATGDAFGTVAISVNNLEELLAVVQNHTTLTGEIAKAETVYCCTNCEAIFLEHVSCDCNNDAKEFSEWRLI